MQIQISWLLQKPSDLDLHCLQGQGISGFSRTRVNVIRKKMIKSVCKKNNTTKVKSWPKKILGLVRINCFQMCKATEFGENLEVTKLFSCSTQLSIKFVLLIDLKLLTIANSFLLNITEHENFSANKYENANY